MKLYMIGLIISVTLGRCASSTAVAPTADATAADGLIIRGGTSYGYCIGYCDQQVELSATKAIFTKKGTRAPAQYPTKTCTTPLTETEWTALKAQANLALLQKQPVTLGCPDCADGGAEFLEIEQGAERYRVTFEAGKSIPGFDGLITALRDKRKSFSACQ